MMDDDIEFDDDLPPLEPDPRIKETVAYATSGIELILNAEFLLDDWVTAALLRDASLTHLYRRNSMTPEQKFLLVAQESGMHEDDEFGGKQVFGVLLDLYRLRARARCLSDEVLTAGILESAVRHWGAETREDCYLPLSFARQVVADHLAYAEAWFSVCTEDTPNLYDPETFEDPGWEPREGGSCNFITD